MQTQVSSEQVDSRGGRYVGTPGLIVAVSTDLRRRIVHLGGELDIATGLVAREACIVGDDLDVVVDLGDVTFMDSGGYHALVSARESLRQRGVTMTLRNLRGQPARIIALLAVLDARAGRGRTELSCSGSTSQASVFRGVPAGFNGSALG